MERPRVFVRRLGCAGDVRSARSSRHRLGERAAQREALAGESAIARPETLGRGEHPLRRSLVQKRHLRWGRDDHTHGVCQIDEHVSDPAAAGWSWDGELADTGLLGSYRLPFQRYATHHKLPCLRGEGCRLIFQVEGVVLSPGESAIGDRRGLGQVERP